ncbi:MAG: replication-associated recombination protein A [Halobacteriovoraceae bacterium]|nr:replication-associated recombination protein A [Halobacteriovoraceae bacterium]
MQTNLFDEPHSTKSPVLHPLAYRMRPQSFSQFYGHDSILKRFPMLRDKNPPSFIVWGPPGTGKTTLAHLVAKNANFNFYPFNAVLGGVNDLKKIIANAIEMKSINGRPSLLFVDEIHRFNKAQQDALLPYVEEGCFTLVGATTENPRSSVNKALLSRLHIIELKPLKEKDILSILERAKEDNNINCSIENLQFIASRCHGDTRKALNYLAEIEKNPNITETGLRKLILENAREYDRNQNRHYDVVSAFIKSMRGSDPDSSILWLAVMIDGGEDPVFIARRLVIFASEDIGNANPMALNLAVSTLLAVQNIGMPEARINLSQTVIFLACSPKSNSAYLAINKALEFVKNNATLEVPEHLKNFPDKNHPIKYKYPHSYPKNYTEQHYSDPRTPQFYEPSEQGEENLLKRHIENLTKV